MNAIVFKIMKNRSYSVISNRHMFNKSLSMQAKGMLNTMLGLPDDWKFSIDGLVQMSSNGRASVRSILKELTDFGYIRIEQGRNEKGQITSIYYIYESPEQEASSDPAQEHVCTAPLDEVAAKANGIVFKVMKNRSYTVISNRHMFNKNMSWGAKGMLDNMLGAPANWKFSIDGLVQMSSNGRASVRSLLKELTDFGYIRIEQGRNEKGQITSIYYIYESPEQAVSDVGNGTANGSEGRTLAPEQSPVSTRCENRTRCETPRDSALETPVSTECENRTRCENRTTFENRTWMNQQSESTDLSVSPGAENRTRLAECGSPNADSRTQTNNKNNYVNINNNIYTSCAPNEDKLNPLSVSPVSPCGTKTEEDVLASLKERIGYDRLIDQGYPRQTLDLLIDVMLEVYRTDKRQMRCAGLLRSVKDIRARLDQLDSAHVAHVLDCYLDFDGMVERPRPYLRTALFNALVSYNEDQRTKHLSSEEGIDWILSDLMNAQIEAPNMPDQPVLRT